MTGFRRQTDRDEPTRLHTLNTPHLSRTTEPEVRGLTATATFRSSPALYHPPFEELDDSTVSYQTDLATLDLEDGFPEVDDLTGRSLGQYRIGPVIGHGSMGRVYQAEHEFLCRPCAIKVLNPGLVARQPQIREQFWSEARVVANLVHPHVVTVHNLGFDRDYHFIEMEYVPGGISLRETLIKEGPLEPVRASKLVRQVVQALGAAHRSGLVHRDVKPANVLLTREGQAKLADFGLVRQRGDLESSVVKVAGTPSFMAPELFGGAPATPRSDIYAVGVMFYYLLTARLPYAADRISRLIRLHQSQPVPNVQRLVPQVSAELADLIARCMAKNPADRFASAQNLLEQLDVVIAQLRDTEGLLRESIDGIDCFVQGARDQFRILFNLPNDRLQEVYLEVGPNRHDERVLTVFSVCCPAEPRHYEFALRLNAEMTYGGLSIREVNNQAMFVMTRTFPRGHVQPEAIRTALVDIARRSDWVEQQLTHADVY